MDEWEVLDMLSLSKSMQAQKFKLLDLLFVQRAEALTVKGPLGLWPFPALNTFLYNVRLLTKIVKR
ncbi:MAG: hypothetical protein QXK47_04875 [Candidatus Bathyarchaeia archaeon]